MRRIEDGKVATLRATALFRGMRDSDLDTVARTGELVTARGGAVLERAGDRPARWWLVVSGVVVLDGPDGTSVAVRGDTWGITQALSRAAAAATATACDDVDCLVVDAARLAPLLHAVPDLAVGLLRR